MGMQVGGNKGGAMAEMNVVPLIDILLVLLIIFMMINPQNEMGLNALVPQPAPPNEKQEDISQQVIVVQVFADGKLKINEEDSSWDKLEARLEEIFAKRATKVAFVKGDNDVLFAQVARAIDVMKQAGIDSVGFLTPQMEKGQ